VDTPVAEGVLIGDRYRIGLRLGRGGMADVYDAQDERLARPVAVKLLRPELAVHPDVRRRFEAEARAAARLSHPNVVAVHDTGDDGGRAYIVMERLPGDTLADRIAAGPVDQVWLRRVALEVLAALGAAHAAGIVHRDVKPGNILMSSDGRAKVADFGIAKTVEPLAGTGTTTLAERDLTATGMVIGTPAYLAPERIDGHPATAQSDLYAVGVVMYEALTGRKAFPGTTPLAVAYSARHEPPPDPRLIRPDADPRMVAVVGQAMAHDPAARFVSAGAMMSALGHEPAARPAEMARPAESAPVGSGGRDVTRRMPGPARAPATVVLRRPTGPAVRRRRWLAALVGAAVIAATLALIALAGRQKHFSATGGPVPSATAARSASATSTTVAAAATTPATQPSDPAGDQLRQLAGSLSAANGSAAHQLQSGLNEVADLPPGSQARADAATALLAQATTWFQRHQLDPATYGQAINVLQQAGGSLPAVTTTTKHKDKKGGGGG
jgi:Protein kinase domain